MNTNSIFPRRFENLRFLQLALFVLILLLLTSIFPNALLLRSLLALVFLDTLFVTLSAVGVGLAIRGALLAVWLAGTVLILISDLHLLDRFDRIAIVAGHGAYLLLVAGGVVATMRYVLTARHVSLDLIFGAVVAYLLIGIGFALLYTTLLMIDPQAFNIPDIQEIGSDAALESEMIYFSLVTIATLGYGDITPRLSLPRILAGLEAVIGQFYIAIIIAWLVSRHVADQDK